MIALYVIIGIIVLVLLIAAIVGTAWSYEKSILINAPASKVWAYTGTLRGLNSWNPWVEKDPGVKMEFGPTDGVPGANYSWDSDVKQVGAGKQTILSITSEKEMATQVTFLRPFKGTGNAYVKLADEIPKLR